MSTSNSKFIEDVFQNLDSMRTPERGERFSTSPTGAADIAKFMEQLDIIKENPESITVLPDHVKKQLTTGVMDVLNIVSPNADISVRSEPASDRCPLPQSATLLPQTARSVISVTPSNRGFRLDNIQPFTPIIDATPVAMKNKREDDEDEQLQSKRPKAIVSSASIDIDF